jgi:hypothetical protein
MARFARMVAAHPLLLESEKEMLPEPLFSISQKPPFYETSAGHRLTLWYISKRTQGFLRHLKRSSNPCAYVIFCRIDRWQPSSLAIRDFLMPC